MSVFGGRGAINVRDDISRHLLMPESIGLTITLSFDGGGSVTSARIRRVLTLTDQDHLIGDI